MSEPTATRQESNQGEKVGSSRWEDLMGPDLQLRVISAGDESKPVEAGDAIFVNFRGHVKQNRDDSTDGLLFHEAEQWLITIGDKEVVPALELGLRFMKEGETAVIWSHSKYAYGCFGRLTPSGTEMPPDSPVSFTVTVTKVVHDEETFSKPEFQFAVARSKKDMGNDVYKNEWQKGQGRNKALLLYKKATDLLNNLLQELYGELEDSMNQQCVDLLVDCLNNISAVHLRTKEYKQAKEAATQVLLRDVNNAKALCRAARASMMDPASTLEEAEGAVVAAEEVLETSESSQALKDDIRKLRSELLKRKRSYRRHERAMASQMTQNSNREKIAEKFEEEAKDRNGLAHKNHGEPLQSEMSKPRTKTAGRGDSFSAKYGPYLIQAIVPLVTFALYLLAKRFSGVQHFAGEEISDVMPENGQKVNGVEF